MKDNISDGRAARLGSLASWRQEIWSGRSEVCGVGSILRRQDLKWRLDRIRWHSMGLVVGSL